MGFFLFTLIGALLGKAMAFFKKHANDLMGKTVIPFATLEGSGLPNCVEDVKDAFPGANVTKGFSIYGREVRTEMAKDIFEK